MNKDTTNTTSGAADLPEALRVPLDSLHADAGYLCGRLLNGSLTQEQVVESIRRRIDAAKLAALTAQAISAEPAEHVQNPAENEHVAGDVSGNGAGLNMSTPHARITELESQLAQRFDAADMATAAAQGFRDGATAPAQPVAEPAKADSVLEDAARLDWLDKQIKAQDLYTGFGWRAEGSYEENMGLVGKVQAKKEKMTARQAIDAARKQGASQ